MNCRLFKSFLFSCFFVLFLGQSSLTVAAEENNSRPNFILCMADDQGWGDVAYNGHPVLQTPVLDEMARTGLRFDNFYAACPVCSPTRGSVLTGRHPNRFGCFSWGHTLRPQEITIAEALKEAGYTTGHFGKWHLGSVRKNSPVNPGQSGFDEWASSPNFYENSPLLSHNGDVIETEGESSMVTIDLALNFMKSATKKDQPFLAVIWFGNPHTPHQAQDHLKKLYPKQKPALQNYYGEVTGIDQAMGHLRKQLRSLNIADNTLLWYTSDNGGRKPGSTGGLRGQKGSVWEGGLKVPAIIEWPAVVKSPRQIAMRANTVDIFPTLLDIVDTDLGEIEKQIPVLDGVSLQPTISGNEQSRPGFGFWQYPTRGNGRRSREMLVDYRKELQAGTAFDDPEKLDADAGKIEPIELPERFPGHAAWIEGDLKLHRIPTKGNQFRYELYDLASDPKETTDILGAQVNAGKEMTGKLHRWQTSVMHSFNGEDYRD
ncbi:sulfatase-like hydrolase/transferase [Thalassoroseus pseudoceratinae]|uniref:sulfatase-like hydrolase/transferase n=1 Tax=Thalassoroseus pseudoceratinae TaxID=2713176 RepID=UPI00141FDEFA|nr:sulfatase-like hydrolase/transferase [Thalassoroseus pseudoceratinae]